MVIISLTTIPSRIDKLYITLNSLFNQSFFIDKIIINISATYKRFPNFNINDYTNIFDKLEKNNKIIINICDDYGPASKILPIIDNNNKLNSRLNNIDNIDDNTQIIFIDDDRDYERNLVKNLIDQNNKYPNYCICIGIWDTHIVGKQFNYEHKLFPRAIEYKSEGYGDILLGCCGVLVKKYMLYNHNFFNHISKCPDLFYSDDLFLSAVLAKNNICIYSVIGTESKRTENNNIDALVNIERNIKYINSMNYLIKEFDIWHD